jgi:hypothetical protein
MVERRRELKAGVPGVIDCVKATARVIAEDFPR